MPVLRAKPAPPSDDKRWKIVETRMRRLGDRPYALIEALHAAQEAFGFLDEDALTYVGDTLGVPHSRVYGVATFYSFFTLKPQGQHTCVVCTGTACYINGAKDILNGLQREFGVRPKETTPDGKLSLLTARCLGALVAELVDAAVARRGQPVALVRVRHAATIPEVVLRQAFEMLAAGGPLATAKLVAEPFEVRLSCPCGFDGALGHDDVVGPGSAVCPGCSELREVATEAELELLEVRLAS